MCFSRSIIDNLYFLADWDLKLRQTNGGNVSNLGPQMQLTTRSVLECFLDLEIPTL
ncbi:hypothetical protein RHMOL_Rhmol07G0313600 [Rhododendron molle]|uniref:Uncharacterized protein n=1 Tax=Rhododendron molle TaxID=49168 RepID=A0ACC0N8N6_RHOML|nr:hypothetical protein RHMOL_Rhmol07G0313600 [Rhododendron molle]